MIASQELAGNLEVETVLIDSGSTDGTLEIAREFSFGHAYATTIKHWMKRYLSNLDTLNKMGFDNNFHRLWIFYLSYCQAGFKVGDIDVVQFELVKP